MPLKHGILLWRLLFLHLQPILKGLPRDADRLEQLRVGELIGRAVADTENGCNTILVVYSMLGHLLFLEYGMLVSIKLLPEGSDGIIPVLWQG